jgi:hypothetical protein
MLLDYFARPRRQPMRWTAGLAVTALVGTILVTDGAPAAATATEIDLPSTVLATPDELPDGTITRVKVTDSLIALEVANDGFPRQVWTRARSGAEPTWRQVDGLKALRDAEGGLVRGSLTGIGNVVMRVSDGSYRAIPDHYQLDRGGEYVSFFDRASVTIQEAVSGSGVATVPLGGMSRPFAGHQVAGSLIGLPDGEEPLRVTERQRPQQGAVADTADLASASRDSRGKGLQASSPFRQSVDAYTPCDAPSGSHGSGDTDSRDCCRSPQGRC